MTRSLNLTEKTPWSRISKEDFVKKGKIIKKMHLYWHYYSKGVHRPIKTYWHYYFYSVNSPTLSFLGPHKKTSPAFKINGQIYSLTFSFLTHSSSKGQDQVCQLISHPPSHTRASARSSPFTRAERTSRFRKPSVCLDRLPRNPQPPTSAPPARLPRSRHTGATLRPVGASPRTAA